MQGATTDIYEKLEKIDAKYIADLKERLAENGNLQELQKQNEEVMKKIHRAQETYNKISQQKKELLENFFHDRHGQIRFDLKKFIEREQGTLRLLIYGFQRSSKIMRVLEDRLKSMDPKSKASTSMAEVHKGIDVIVALYVAKLDNSYKELKIIEDNKNSVEVMKNRFEKQHDVEIQQYLKKIRKLNLKKFNTEALKWKGLNEKIKKGWNDPKTIDEINNFLKFDIMKTVADIGTSPHPASVFFALIESILLSTLFSVKISFALIVMSDEINK